MLRALRSQNWCAKLMWSFPSHNSISLVLEMYERNIEEMIRNGSITGFAKKKIFANSIREGMNHGLTIIQSWCHEDGIKTSLGRIMYMEFNKPTLVSTIANTWQMKQTYNIVLWQMSHFTRQHFPEKR
jgi:hypothetical protein